MSKFLKCDRAENHQSSSVCEPSSQSSSTMAKKIKIKQCNSEDQNDYLSCDRARYSTKTQAKKKTNKFHSIYLPMISMRMKVGTKLIDKSSERVREKNELSLLLVCSFFVYSDLDRIVNFKIM